MKNTKGITLVALVITIIILLILAGISIQALTQTNLFGKTEQAKVEMDNAQRKENDTLSNYVDRVNEYLPDTDILSDKVSKGKIAIGSYVNYVPDEVTENDEKYKKLLSNLATYSGNTNGEKNTEETIKQEGLKWKVLDVKDGQVRLISATPTDAKICLKNYSGYNNGVKLIDDTCNTLYNNVKLASKVQNLKIEDIEEKMKEKDYSKFNEDYGKTFTYTTENRYYPNISLKEKDQEVTIGKTTIKETELGRSEQNEYIKQEAENGEADVLKVKYTSWWKTMQKEDFYNSEYYKLFIKDETKDYDYWLSSRCAEANSDNAFFEICHILIGGVRSYYLYYSNGKNYSASYACRPVITLNSNVQIDTANPGDGTENNAYNIK